MTKGFAVIRDEREGLSVSYEDFNVEYFDGMDYEVKYELDAANKRLLRAALAADGYEGTLQDMIRNHFGPYLDRDSFSVYCSNHEIRYKLFAWQR